MQYFVTGATGFIGKRLVKALLARRGATVHFLVRPGSEGKLADLYDYWGVSKARDETLEIRSLNNARSARARKGKAADLGFKPNAVTRVE